MKHKAVTKRNQMVRGLYKTVATLVALLGMVYGLQAQTADLVGKYPFPQNYSYPKGATYMNPGSTSQIQLLFDNWKKNYYEEGKVGGVPMARIKFVQSDEPAGANTVSEGIAYGMLVTLWMDNATNKTKNMFDKLFTYYKFNKDPMTGVLMNWKVVGFTGTVTAPASGNSNSATDADLDVAASLILAAEQWPDDKTYYKAEASKMLNAIWSNEVLSADYHLKPGDAFDDWLNPCYFITNELELFHRFEPTRGWDKVRDKSYAIMKKAANATTGLMPDWVNNDANYTYCKDNPSNPKFTSHFLYDAIRCPWRLAMAYSWYGHADAYTMASKMVDWAIGKYGNSPGQIVDGYFLDGTPFDGAKVGLGTAYPTHGKNKNPCFSGGIGVAGMVDGTKYSSWIPAVWSAASTVDAYGMYYTNTCQLMYMMYMTGNMPNLTDMQPVYVSSVTNTTGTKITVTFSKDLLASSVTASAAGFVIMDGYGKAHTVSSVVAKSGKVIELTLSKAVIKAPYTIAYSGTTLQSTDATPKAVAPFGPFDVEDKVTEGVPSLKSARTDALGSKVFVVMDKEMDGSTLDLSEFAITVNGTAVTISEVALNAKNAYQVDLTIKNTPVASKLDVIKLTYSGSTMASVAYALADPFTATVNNMYLSTTCVIIDDVSGNAGWKTWGSGDVELVNDPATATVNQVLHFNTGGGDNDVKTMLLASKKLRDAFNAGNNVLTYRIYPKTAMSNLRFRLFDVTNAEDWGDNQILNEGTSFAAGDLNKWTEKTIDLSGFSGGTYPIDGMSMDVTPGVKDAGEFYIDDIRLCAAIPVPHIVGAYTSWDGKTIVARYNVPVAAPATVTGLTGAAVSPYNSVAINVTSITEKSGDGTELIFNLETPVAAGDTIKLKYVKATGSIVDVNGVATESFDIIATNTVGVYITSGWYDDFNDLKDYVTLSVGGDYKTTEDDVATTGAVAGKLVVSGSTLSTTDKYKALVVSVKDQVWDLTKNPFVTIRYNYAGTGTVYGKIQLKDVTGVSADEMSNFTLNSGWNEVTVDFSGHFVERYQGKGVRTVNPAAITAMQLFLSTSTTTGLAYTGNLDIDKIVIGKPIRIYSVATEVEQTKTVAATANFDGALYLVPAATDYTLEAFKAAVFAKTGTTINCTANVAAAIPTTGLAAGSYIVVGYYPSTGSLTSAAYVSVKDVTAPKITSTLATKYPYGASLSITTDEKARIYLVPFGTPATDLNFIKYTADCNQDTIVYANPTANMELVDTAIISRLGTNFMIYAVDDSKNVSVASASFTISDVTAPTFSLAKTTYPITGAFSALNVTDISDVTLYLVPNTAAIATVADLKANAKASVEHLADVADLAPFTMQIANAAFKLVPVGYYYAYIADKWGNISAPSPLINVTSSTIAVSGISIPATFTLDKATTISATDPNASLPQSVTFTPTGANNILSIVWESANSDYVVVFPGTTPGTAILVGRQATTSAVNVTVTVKSGASNTDINMKTWTATMAVTVVGSSNTLPTGITITKGGVSASKTTVDVALGATATFAATIAPAEAKDRTYSFTSRNSAIATVNAAGVVTPVSVGSTYVVVSATAAPTVMDSVLINVPAIPVTTVTIATPASQEVTIGNILSLTATVLPDNATFQDITWTTSDANIATVSATPVVSGNTSTIKVGGVAAGTVTITATSAKYAIKSTMEITVVSGVKLPKEITATPLSIDLKVGESATAAPVLSFTPSDATNKEVTWTVEPSTLATVTASGIVTAGATAGAGYLVATSKAVSTVSVRIPLTITDYAPTSVVLDPATGLSIKVGETKSVFTSVSVLPAKAPQAVTYSITPTTIATIDPATGKVTGVSKGTATITVTAANTTVTKSVDIEVLPVLVSSITINNSTLDLIKGNQATLKVTEVLPAGASDKSVVWSSSAPAIVSVDAATGHIKALAVGSATIKATANDGSLVSASCVVTVAPLALTVNFSNPTGFTLKTTDAAVTNTATVSPDSSDVKTVVFAVTSGTGVVTISQTGNVVTITPATVGKAVITATVTGTTYSSTFTVDVVTDIKDVESVTLTPASASLFLGDADSLFTAVVAPEGAIKTVSWKSTDEAVVTVVGGLVHIVGAGTAKVVATSTANTSIADTTIVTVAPRYVSDITLSVSSIKFTAKDETKTIVATISPANATTKGVTFESSAPSVVSVDADGKVTALVAEGTATITVKSADGKVSKTVDVTITKATVSTIVASSTADIAVAVGGNATLPTITVTMSDASTSTATWSSSDKTIVDFVNGKLVALTPGSTTIVATADADPTKKVTINVVVSKVPVSSITLSADAVTVGVDASKDIAVTINPDNATFQTVTAVPASAGVTATVSGKTVTVKGVTVSSTPVNVVITVDGISKACAVTVAADVVAVSSVEFDVPNVTIQRNVTDKKLGWTVLPLNASDKSVTLTSSDETVVKVAADGTLTPLKAGSATITVKAGDKTGTCTVTIEPIAVISIAVSQNAVSIAPNGTTDVSKLLLVNPVEADNVVPAYTITPTSVATINPTTGLVTGVAVGTATVTITVGTKTAEVTVNVSSDVVDVTSVVAVGEKVVSVKETESVTLSAKVSPDNATVQTITWVADQTDPIYVELTDNKDGTCSVKGMFGGTVTVYAVSNNNKKVAFTVNVTSVVKSISITAPQTEIVKGESTIITASVGPNSAKQVVEFSIASGSGLTLVPLGDKTVTIKADGNFGDVVSVVAKSTDGTNITSLPLTFKVIEQVIQIENITATITPETVAAGETAQIAVTYIPANTTQTGVLYSSSNPDFTVSADGVVTANHGGTATITITSAKNSAVKKTVKLTATEKVTGFVLTLGSTGVGVGSPSVITVDAQPSTATTKAVTVESSDINIATVSIDSKTGNVIVTGVNEGTATIKVTATDGSGVSQTIQVTVTRISVTGVKVTSAPIKINVGATSQIVASVTPTNATVQTLAYTSSDETIATVSATGLVKGLAKGNVTITVSSVDNPSQKATVSVNVLLELPNVVLLQHVLDSVMTEYNKITGKPKALSDTVTKHVATASAYINQVDQYDGGSLPTQAEVDKEVILLRWAIAQYAKGVVTPRPTDEAIVTVEFEFGPNPAAEFVNVIAEDITSIQIVDINGKTVAESSQSTISIDGVAKGTYTLIVNTVKGSASKRIVKQ